MAGKGMLQVTPVTYREALGSLDYFPRTAFKNKFSYPRRLFHGDFTSRDSSEMLKFLQKEEGGKKRGGWGADYLLVAARHTPDLKERLRLYSEAVSRLVEDGDIFFSRYPKLGAEGADEAARFCEAIGKVEQALYFHWRAAWFAKEALNETLISKETENRLRGIFKANAEILSDIPAHLARLKAIPIEQYESKMLGAVAIDNLERLQNTIEALHVRSREAETIKDHEERARERGELAEKFAALGFHEKSAKLWWLAANDYYGGEDLSELDSGRRSAMKGHESLLCLMAQKEEQKIAQDISKSDSAALGKSIAATGQRIEEMETKLAAETSIMDAFHIIAKQYAPGPIAEHNSKMEAVRLRFVGKPEKYRVEKTRTVYEHSCHSILDHLPI